LFISKLKIDRRNILFFYNYRMFTYFYSCHICAIIFARSSKVNLSTCASRCSRCNPAKKQALLARGFILRDAQHHARTRDGREYKRVRSAVHFSERSGADKTFGLSPNLPLLSSTCIPEPSLHHSETLSPSPEERTARWLRAYVTAHLHNAAANCQCGRL